MINIEQLREYSERIKIIGHPHADFDSMTSGYLLQYILFKLGVTAEFVIQDGEVDEFFAQKWIGRHSTWKKKDTDVLFLVDHTAKYDLPIIGCFDHHPELAHISHNYINEPKTSCAKVIYDWAESIGVEIPRSLITLVVYSCYMDSLSFKSTKARPEDLAWCREMIQKYNMDEDEVINFGYGLTNRNQNYHDYLLTGLKTYALGDKWITSSYAVVADDMDDLDKVAKELRKELSDDIIAWCYIQSNVKSDKTRIVLITSEYYLIQTVDKLLSRGQNIIPAVMEFLSLSNNTDVTKKLIEKNIRISIMESCTSGLITSNITDCAGASAIFKGSNVTYSNEEKIRAGVRADIIETYGVYSLETAFDMALAIKDNFKADIGIGITGSFSNVDPNNADSVAGVIYYHIEHLENEYPIKLVFGNLDVPRNEMKQKTVDIVLKTLMAILNV